MPEVKNTIPFMIETQIIADYRVEFVCCHRINEACITRRIVRDKVQQTLAKLFVFVFPS